MKDGGMVVAGVCWYFHGDSYWWKDEKA